MFVWRDELEADYARTFGRVKYISVRPGVVEPSEEEVAAELEDLIRLCRNPDTADEADAAFKRSMEKAERNTVCHPGDGQLNFTPLLSADEEKVAFEGFEFVLPTGQRMSPLDAAAAPLESLGVVTAATPQLVRSRGPTEAPKDRQDRRLRELKAMGGDYVEKAGEWRATGPRGNVVKLARNEKAAGRPMSDEKDVREDLKMAATRFSTALAAGCKGNSVFNQ